MKHDENTTKQSKAIAYQATYAFGPHNPQTGYHIIHVLGGDESDDPLVAVLPDDVSDDVLKATVTALGYKLTHIDRLPQ
jgi:hypothetical protein